MLLSKTLILSQKDIARLIDFKGAIFAVEQVFREYGRGYTQMPPKFI